MYFLQVVHVEEYLHPGQHLLKPLLDDAHLVLRVQMSLELVVSSSEQISEQ